MPRIIRIVGGALAALLLVVVLAIAALLLVDADAYKGIVESRLSEALGRQVAVADLDIGFGGTTTVAAAGVTIAGTEEVPESRLERVEVALQLWPLLRRELRVERLLAGPGTLHLRQADFRRDDGDGADRAGMRLARLERVELRDLGFSYRADGRHAEGRLDSLVVAHDPVAGRTALQGRGSVDGAPFTLDGTAVQPDQITGGLDSPIPIQVTAALADARLRVEGTVRPGPALDAAITAEAPETAALLHLMLMDVPTIGPLRATARLRGDATRTALADIDLAVGREDGALRASLAGGIEDVTRVEGVDLRFRATIPDVRAMRAAFRLPPQVTGRIEASGQVDDRGGALRIVDLTVTAVDPGRHELQLAGEIGRVGAPGAMPVDAVNLTLTGTVRQMPGLPAPAGGLLAHFGPAAVSGRLTGGGDGFVLEDLRVAAMPDAPTRLAAAGRIGRIALAPALRLAEIDIALEGEAAGLEPLRPALAMLRPGAELPPLPDLGPLALQGRIGGDTVEGLRLSGLTARITEGAGAGTELAGEIGDLLAAAGIRLQAKLALDSLDRLSDTVGAPLPPIAPFRAEATIAGDAPALAVRDIDIRGGGEGGARLAASGSIANLAKAEDFSLQASIEAPSLAALNAGLPADSGAVSVNGTLTATPDGLVELRNARIAIGDAELNGTATLTPDEPRPVLQARLTSPHLRLVPLRFDAPDRDDDARARDGRVFPAGPLPIDGLKRIDANVVLQADSVSYAGHQARGLKLAVVLTDGRLTARLDELAFGEGAVRGELGIDAAQDPPAWRLDAAGDGIEMAAVSNLLDQPLRIDGKARADARLQSRGRSPAEIAGNLSGRAAFASGGGTIETGALNYIAADVLLEVFRRTASPREDTHLECLLADFEIDRGIAEARTLFLSTDEIRIIGSGRIDLRRERYDLALVPNPKDPALFSLSTRVLVGGPLGSPQVRPDPGGLAISALKAVVGNALLPGAGLLLPLLETGAGGEHPCKGEVQQTASDAGLIGAAVKGIGGAVQGVGRGVGRAVEGAGKGVGGAVRGLGKALGLD